MLSVLKLNGFEHNALITPTWLEAYRAPFGTPEACLGAISWPSGFAEGAHAFETPDTAALQAIRRLKPSLP